MEICGYFPRVSGGAEGLEKPAIVKEVTFAGRSRYVHFQIQICPNLSKDLEFYPN